MNNMAIWHRKEGSRNIKYYVVKRGNGEREEGEREKRKREKRKREKRKREREREKISIPSEFQVRCSPVFLQQ